MTDKPLHHFDIDLALEAALTTPEGKAFIDRVNTYDFDMHTDTHTDGFGTTFAADYWRLMEVLGYTRGGHIEAVNSRHRSGKARPRKYFAYPIAKYIQYTRGIKSDE